MPVGAEVGRTSDPTGTGSPDRDRRRLPVSRLDDGPRDPEVDQDQDEDAEVLLPGHQATYFLPPLTEIAPFTPRGKKPPLLTFFGFR